MLRLLLQRLAFGLLITTHALADSTPTMALEADIIELSKGAEGVVGVAAWRLAVFIKKSDRPFEKREQAIAEIARSVRAYYLFAQAP